MRDSRGFTLIELLIVIAIVGVLMSIAVAGYQTARIRGDESSAVASLDSINKAQFAYAQTCGNQRYAPTLVSLGTPVPASGVSFLSPDLAQPDPLIKSGYFIRMARHRARRRAAPKGLHGRDPRARRIRSLPIPSIRASRGSASFGTNSDRVIFDDQATFIGNMPETGPPAHGREIK